MLKDNVERIIERIRPSFQTDGHDLELVEITDDNVVRISLCGHCQGGCTGSKVLMGLEVERALQRRIPSVKKVEVVSRVKCLEEEGRPA
jgi:Fe-S cluster biogenesis protein NfuA